MSFPIVFSTDNNYLVPTYIAISSLLHYIDTDTDIDIYILCSGISELKKQYFYNLSSNIHFLDIEIEPLNINKDFDYISIATYYRLMIPDKLKQYDKCLYLDSDIIIKDDITPLINMPIEDYFLIGVRNYFSRECYPYFYEERCKDCSIETLDYYINAGILLMNLKLFRENNLSDKMIDDASKNIYSYNDQDLLNKYCNGKIGLLSLKYNFMVQYLNRKEIVSEVLKEDIYEVAKNPVIIHYSTRKKPWKYKGHLLANCFIDEIKYIKDKKVLIELINPFIKEQRKSRTFKEKILDNLKYILRKYIQRNFIYTIQKKP